MHGDPVSPVVQIVAEALVLRRSRPQLSAIQVLDEVMRKRHGRPVDFGELIKPPAPFAFLVAEALDRGMERSDWEGLWNSRSRPDMRPFLLDLFADEVWPKFVVRYSLY